MEATLKLIVQSVEHDVSSLLRTCQQTVRACNENFHHAVSTCTLTLRYSSQLLSLLTSTDDVLAVLEIEGARVFTGRVSPSSIHVSSWGTAISLDPDVEDIHIELEDFTYKLSQKIADDLVLEQVFICNPSSPNTSIVHILLSLAGVSSNISTPILTILPAFAVDSGTIGEVLDTLLYEYGYTYSFNAYGQVILIPYIYDTITPAAILTESDIQAPLVIEKIAYEADAVEVSYYPLSSRQNVLLYMADLPFNEKGLRSGYPIQPGYLWPEEANVQPTWFEYDDKALASRLNERGEVVPDKEYTSILLTKNHQLEENYEYGVSREITVFRNKRAQIAYRNTESIPKLIYYCNIRADVVYRSSQVLLMHALKTNPTKTDRYDTLFVHDKDTARRLCAFHAERLRSACWRYRFKLAMHVGPGIVLRLVDPFAGVDAMCLLQEQYVDYEDNTYEYRAIGLAVPTIIQPISKSTLFIGPSFNTKTELSLLESARLSVSAESCSLRSDWLGNADLSEARTTMDVLLGEKEDTENWTFRAVESPGIFGLLSQNTYYVTRMELSGGFVDLIATYKHINLLSNIYAKLGQQIWGNFKFAHSIQLSKRFFISKAPPFTENPISTYLPHDSEFVDKLASSDSFIDQLVANSAFINNLTSNSAFIDALGSKYIKIQSGGSLRGGDRFNQDGNVVDNSALGFWLGSDGRLKVRDAYLDGCLYAYNCPFSVVAAFNISDGTSLQLLSQKNISSVSKEGTGIYRINFTTAVKTRHHLLSDGHRYIDMYVVANAHDTFANGFNNPLIVSINWVRNYIEGRVPYDNEFAYVTYALLYTIDNNIDQLLNVKTMQGFIAISETR